MNKIISVVGYTNSGKTMLIQEILHWCKRRDLNVIVIKHHHESSLKGSKDTDKYLESGSKKSVLIEPGGVFSFSNIDEYKALDDVINENLFRDLIIIEGFKKSIYNKIVLCDDRDFENVENSVMLIKYRIYDDKFNIKDQYLEKIIGYIEEVLKGDK